MMLGTDCITTYQTLLLGRNEVYPCWKKQKLSHTPPPQPDAKWMNVPWKKSGLCEANI